MKYMKVKDETHLIKDIYSKAVLNTDKDILKKHEMKMRQVERDKSQQVEINSLKEEINELRKLIENMLKR
jgi:cystathionine beta-lyase family protein involved in aluminum resistance